MSKSLYNVVNPDDICREHGADVFRLYEMFLGPLEQHKPWNTHGINGVSGFLRRLTALFLDEEGRLHIQNDAPNPAELKVLHQTIKKTGEDIEKLSFNTCVSQFMICVNELTGLKCRKRSILETLLVVLSPFAPHLCEELWERLGNSESIFRAGWPEWKAEFLVESEIEYALQVNGKLRGTRVFSADSPKEELENFVRTDEHLLKYLEGRPIKKVIVVPGKIINLVG
jgi:leucyl-tRNA synthetase